MKKCLCLFLCLLLLASCAPSTQTQEVTINLSEIEALPEDMEGSFLCTVTYTPGEELSASVRNDTEFYLSSGIDAGLLYYQGKDGLWESMGMPGPTAGELVYTFPGKTNEDAFFTAGFNKPKLESGSYKLVFVSYLEGEELDKELKFDLEIPFSVS